MMPVTRISLAVPAFQSPAFFRSFALALAVAGTVLSTWTSTSTAVSPSADSEDRALGKTEVAVDRAPGGSPYRYRTEMTAIEFTIENTSQFSAGRSLVDIEVRSDGLNERFTGIWAPVDGEVHTLIYGTTAQWNDFIAEMAPRNGRYLDVEVGYFNNLADKRYSAIFYEDGDDYAYALRTTNTDAGFQNYLEQYLDDGYSIIDFEAYNFSNGGTLDIRYAGVWVRDPNQPRTSLYYGLESADVSDLLRPLAGRVIDFERYYSPIHSGYRYAIIVAMVPGGEWGHWRNVDSAQLSSLNNSISDANTHLIDLDVWESNGTVRYGVVWGDDVKSLDEVPAIAPDPDPEPLPSGLVTQINNFEALGTNGSPLGIIGLYAKNLRTNQSFGYRKDQPIYLASTAKIAIHTKFWREIQSGHLDLTTTVPYTNGASRRDLWYVDERPGPWGLSSANFGQSIGLDRYDRAMMAVSDNGATSMLVDHPDEGLAFDGQDLNEWLAGVSGVGQGFFPLTSIQEVDRTILWQSGVDDFPQEESYFLVAPWAFEPWWRGQGDRWGDLKSWLDTNRTGWTSSCTFPCINGTNGHRRYYSMGLNSATPKAMSLLLEGLWEGRFLDATNTQAALDRMVEWTPFDDCGSVLTCRDSFPSTVTVYPKGGAKGGASAPRSYAAIFEMGPDAIAVTGLTEDNQRRPATSSITPFAARIGLEVVQGLGANLSTCDFDASSAGPAVIRAGDTFDVHCDMKNLGGGRALGFDVDFYASTNTAISTFDHKIGTVHMSGFAPYSEAPTRLLTEFPASVPPGTYSVGWIIDPVSATSSFGDVGEWDEGDNVGLVSGFQLTVLEPALMRDDLESADLSAWSGSVP